VTQSITNTVRKHSPLISVVIPAYKAENHIARAIDSVLAQEGVAVEVIVVEDGRFDNTHNIVEKYDHRVKLIALKKNHGACFARNTGLAEATGEYVMFLDADDYLSGRLLVGLHEAISKSGASVGFAPCVKKTLNHSKTKTFTPPTYENPNTVITRWLRGKSGPGTCSILWRKQEIIRIGGWNESYDRNQDGELIIRAMFNQCTVTRSMEGFGVYIQHEGDRISRRFKPKSFDSFELLEQYIINQAAKDDENKKSIMQALNYYRANVAAMAYSNQQATIGALWEKKWNRSSPCLSDYGSLGLNVFFIHLLYRFCGIQGGLKIRNSRKKFISLFRRKLM
jgi:glycosyltransferase involved in cell wall biosynthesis